MVQSLQLWLARKLNCQIIGTAEDGEHGMQLCLDTRPELALIDIQIPKINGLSLLGKLLHQLPQTRFVAISGLLTPFTVWSVGQSGVHGYLVKTEDLDVFAQALRTVLNGGSFCSPVFKEVQSAWLAQPETFQMIFTDREKQILLHSVAGLSDEKIELQLEIPAASLAVHRRVIRKKLDVSTDHEVLAYAMRWGLDSHSIAMRKALISP